MVFHISSVLMEQMFRSMRSFDPSSPPDMFEFNHLLQACGPQKVNLPFEQGVACRADETRSLSCKCTDNKIICKGVAQAMMPTVASAACVLQQGFISGRHFTNNLIVIDTISRIYSNLH